MNRAQIPPDIPAEAVSFLEDVGYFEPDLLKVGDSPPVLEMPLLGGADSVRIPVAGNTTVLIFGSYT